MATNGCFYMRSYYYKVKHQVWQALGYKCQICGEDDPEALEIHHEDDQIHNGEPGLNRFVRARQKINNGNDDGLMLVCEDCHNAIHQAEDTEEAEAIVFAAAFEDLEYNGFSGQIEKKDRVRA